MIDSNSVASNATDSNPADSNAAEFAEKAALLNSVADPVRLRLLERLAAEGTRCVCNLKADPPIPANLLSYHLRVLREAGLVSASRRGRWVDYTLTDDALERLHAALPSAVMADAV